MSLGAAQDGCSAAREATKRFGGVVTTTATLASIPPKLRAHGMVVIVGNGTIWQFDQDETVEGLSCDSGTGKWKCLNGAHETFTNPVAPATSLGTCVDDSATPANPTGQPDIPQTLDVAFDANCDGTSVTVSGTGPDGQAVSETFATSAGATVEGAVVFATITATGGIVSSGDGTGTTGTATVQTSGTIGLARRHATVTKLVVGGTQEAATQSAANIAAGCFTPTTAKDGSADFDVWYV